MRLRQIAFAARELAPAEDALLYVLGLETGFRDPGVGKFGLHNAVIPVGGNFLEIVAPVQEGTTAGRFLDRRDGDAGYMVILQNEDAMPLRERAEKLGIRIVWRHDNAGECASHFHPVDVGGVILSVDSFPQAQDLMVENAFWRWAGPEWESHVGRDVIAAMTGVELVNADPAKQAADWSSLLGLPALAKDDGFDIAMSDGGVIRFRPTLPGQLPGIRALDFRPADKAECLRRAAERGLLCGGDWFELMQVRCNLVD